MGKNMKLRIRYENEYQVIELDEKAANRLWVSLALTGGEDMTKEEKEQRIQEAWHEHFNKSDYNCFISLTIIEEIVRHNLMMKLIAWIYLNL